MSAMQIHAVDAPLGARIDGIDLSAAVSGEDFKRIEQALDRHGVIIFPRQRLDDETFKRFSHRFGARLDIHPLTQFAKEGHPEIFVLSNIVRDGHPIGAADAAQYWHSDLSYTPNPSRVTLLYALQVPMDGDRALGDTEFAATDRAYADLDEQTRQRLKGLSALHDAKKEKPRPGSHFAKPQSAEVQEKLRGIAHPVVRRHAGSGRPCLYVNEGFTTAIEGMPGPDSDALLRRLFDHMTQPRYTYRHQWSVGDLVVWDNCLTIHQGIPNYGPHQPRLLNRTIVMGEAPVAA